MTLPDNPVFVALDTPDVAQALDVAGAVRGAVGGVKVGLEFFNAQGPQGVARIVDLDLPVFLDLKYHDIPNTVAGAVRHAAQLGLTLLNVHAAGGMAMLRAARDAAQEGADAAGVEAPLVIGVTVLTSLDEDDLADTGQTGPVDAQVVRLARLTQAAGCHGVVASPREIARLRQACGPDFKLVVPGIRPASAAKGDQKRTMTPAEAVALGADALVIGRPITGAADPAAAAAAIAAEVAATRAA